MGSAAVPHSRSLSDAGNFVGLSSLAPAASFGGFFKIATDRQNLVGPELSRHGAPNALKLKALQAVGVTRADQNYLAGDDALAL